MRVLYLHQHFSTPSGAGGTRSYEFARRLVARGHEVTIVCGSYGMSRNVGACPATRGVRRSVVDGINLVELCLPYSNYDSLFKRSVTFLRYAWKGVRIAFREPYDVLFATSTPLTAGIPGIVMRLVKPRRKFVFEVRDLWPELPKAMGVVTNPFVLAALSLLEKVSYLAMDAGVALSPGIQEGMRRRTPSRTPLEMISNACDLEVFRPSGSSGPDEAALPQGFPRNGLRCVFTGAHGLANGLDAVLDAAAVLRDRGRLDVHLVFIGDGKLKPRLQTRAQEEGLVNCHFFDPLPKQQLAQVMSQIDLGLMILANVPAFYYGTSPNKFFDYIASGLPVVNNYPGWLADLIRTHRCGIAVPPESPQDLADALISLADNRALLQEMGRNARRLAEQEFDRDVLANRFIDFLEHVVTGKRGEHPLTEPRAVRQEVLL